MMKRIILDTNFLLIPAQFKVDIFEEIKRISDFAYEFYIVDRAIEELEKIMLTGNTKDKTAAKVALKFVRIMKIKKIKTKGNRLVDDIIAGLAKEGDIVATQDKELKRRLKNKKIGIIELRQKKYLQIANFK